MYNERSLCRGNLAATDNTSTKYKLTPEVVCTQNKAADKNQRRDSEMWAFPCGSASANKEVEDSMTHHEAHRPKARISLSSCADATNSLSPEIHQAQWCKGIPVWWCFREMEKESSEAQKYASKVLKNASRHARLRLKCQEKQ